MTIDEELKHLPTLECIGRALSQLARSLHPSGDFKLYDRKWVYRPNFVAFSLHYQRARNIRLSLYGNPSEFENKDVLPLEPGRGGNNPRGGYSECQITTARQLAAAAGYIERAYVLKGRGINRTAKTPVTIEEKVKIVIVPPPSVEAFRAKLAELKAKKGEGK